MHLSEINTPPRQMAKVERHDLKHGPDLIAVYGPDLDRVEAGRPIPVFVGWQSRSGFATEAMHLSPREALELAAALTRAATEALGAIEEAGS